VFDRIVVEEALAVEVVGNRTLARGGGHQMFSPSVYVWHARIRDETTIDCRPHSPSPALPSAPRRATDERVVAGFPLAGIGR
jgi:hypothetical protein